MVASIYPLCGWANNITVTNVQLTSQNQTAQTIDVSFDVSWSNSWRNNTNHDSAWVFVKYSRDAGATWNHATLKSSGTNPSGFSTGSGTALEIVVPTDKKGAFVQRSENGVGTVSTTGVHLVWDWGTDGLSQSDSARVRVFAIEMVYIPASAFYAGDNATSSASFKQGSMDNSPWLISNENAIPVSAVTSGGYYYVSAGNSDEDPTASTFQIPGSYPKGTAAFYAMKHEISENQWVDFLAMLTETQRTMRDITSLSGKNSDESVNRNTVSVDVSSISTQRPSRACNYLSWMDFCAYSDWAALRPMSELEFEKICRGGENAVSGEYAWGTASIAAADGADISGQEDGTETIQTSGANALFGGVTFSSGDQGTGPLRCGIFATALSNRSASGSGYYGVMDLSGNLWEHVVTVGNSQGRDFQATQGDGVLTSTAQYEGNATNQDWPGIDNNPDNGITAAGGSGFRGGSWSSEQERLRASDRSKAALASNIRSSDYGGRCVRTAP